MLLTIVIKTLNEADTIGKAVETAIAAAASHEGEVIVVDSLSEDRTAEIVSSYPVRLVQLASVEDRSCGVGGEVGFRLSKGKYLYILDGDMELQADFIDAAIAYLERYPTYAGVGGMVVERNLVGLEYRSRDRRRPNDTAADDVAYLPGGGLYRREAVDRLGYLTNPNLHSFEELELGARLRGHGWKLARLGMTSVHHSSYTMGAYSLLARKWRGGYFRGSGELLRASLGRSHLRAILDEAPQFRISLLLLLWLMFIAMALVIAREGPLLLSATVVVVGLALPILAMAVRKRSLGLGVYSVITWILVLTGLVQGLLKRPPLPTAPIAINEYRDGRMQYSNQARQSR